MSRAVARPVLDTCRPCLSADRRGDSLMPIERPASTPPLPDPMASPEMRTTSIGEATVELLRSTNDVVTSAIPHPVWMKGFVDPLVYAVIVRCLSRYRAIRLLLTNGYQDEAFVVLRSLATDSMRLQYLERHPDTRAANGLWWWMTQVKELEKLSRPFEAVDQDEAARIRNAAALLRAELVDRQRQLGVRKLLPMPAEGRGMARALGQSEGELDYLQATHPSHTTLGSLLGHFETDVDGTTTYFIESTDPRRLALIGGRATVQLMGAAIASASILAWGTLPSLQQHDLRVQASLRAIDQAIEAIRDDRPHQGS